MIKSLFSPQLIINANLIKQIISNRRLCLDNYNYSVGLISDFSFLKICPVHLENLEQQIIKRSKTVCHIGWISIKID